MTSLNRESDQRLTSRTVRNHLRYQLWNLCSPGLDVGFIRLGPSWDFRSLGLEGAFIRRASISGLCWLGLREAFIRPELRAETSGFFPKWWVYSPRAAS